MQNINIVAFIPARSGSKSIVDKNVKLLGGKPLIVWSIQSAINAGIKNVIVDTDSESYGKIAKEWGAEVMIRDKSLAKDKSSMFEVLQAEIPKIKPVPDVVLLLQPTSPFRNKNKILTAISYFTNNLDKFDSLICVEKVPDKYNPAVVIIETPTSKAMIIGKLLSLKDKIASWFTGKTWTEPTLSGVPISQRITVRQNNPQAWTPTGSIYIFKADNLKSGSLYGERVMLMETDPEININSQDDWDTAEEHLLNKNG